MTHPPEYLDLTAPDIPPERGTASAPTSQDVEGWLERTQTPSLDELIAAYQAPGRPHYAALRQRYESEHGHVVESWYARRIHAGALLLRPEGAVNRLRQTRLIKIRYDGAQAAGVQPEFEACLWRARAMQRQTGVVVAGRTGRVLVEVIYSVVVYLLGVLDALVPAGDGVAAGGLSPAQSQRRVSVALASATAELGRLRAWTTAAARRASLRWYLVGLPAGVGIVGVLLLVVQGLPVDELPTQRVQVCLAAGAAGAVVSVMVRVSSGQRLVVDSQQGTAVTVVAGGFRPVIGGILGVAVYVLVAGEVLPLATPDDPASTTLFFAGVAFLAGFSERWAQDTIVRSTSRLSGMTPPSPASPSLPPVAPDGEDADVTVEDEIGRTGIGQQDGTGQKDGSRASRSRPDGLLEP